MPFMLVMADSRCDFSVGDDPDEPYLCKLPGRPKRKEKRRFMHRDDGQFRLIISVNWIVEFAEDNAFGTGYAVDGVIFVEKGHHHGV